MPLRSGTVYPAAVSGERCKGEACADMGGMAVMLHLAKEDPDFDYAAFFNAYAGEWASNMTPEYAYYSASYDVHPLDYLRVNVTVAQFEEFYEAFGVQEGDGMYIAPEDRVKSGSNGPCLLVLLRNLGSIEKPQEYFSCGFVIHRPLYLIACVTRSCG